MMQHKIIIYADLLSIYKLYSFFKHLSVTFTSYQKFPFCFQLGNHSFTNFCNLELKDLKVTGICFKTDQDTFIRRLKTAGVIQKNLVIFNANKFIGKAKMDSDSFILSIWHRVWFAKFSRRYLLSKIIFSNPTLSKNLDKLKPNRGKKKILYICNNQSNGGSEQIPLSFFNALESSGKSKLCIALGTDLCDSRDAFKKIFDWEENLGYHFSDTVKVYALRFYIQIINPETILFFGSGISWIYDELIIYKKKLNIKNLVNLIHNYEVDSFGLSKSNFIYVDKFIVISEHSARFLCKELKISNKTIVVVKNAIKPNLFKRRTSYHDAFRNNFVISWIGNISEIKNPLLMCRLINGIKYNFKNLKVFMIGRIIDPTLYNEVNNFIDRNGLIEYINLTGSISQKKLKGILDQSRVSVMTSKNEGVPLAIIESMSMGVPVISTKVGALEEIITHGKNGFLLDENPNILKNFLKTINIFKDYHYASLLSSNAIQTITKNHNFEKMVSMYEKCL